LETKTVPRIFLTIPWDALGHNTNPSLGSDSLPNPSTSIQGAAVPQQLRVETPVTSPRQEEGMQVNGASGDTKTRITEDLCPTTEKKKKALSDGRDKLSQSPGREVGCQHRRSFRRG